MEMNKAIEAMIQQAESLNAGKATLEFDYGNVLPVRRRSRRSSPHSAANAVRWRAVPLLRFAF